MQPIKKTENIEKQTVLTESNGTPGADSPFGQYLSENEYYWDSKKRYDHTFNYRTARKRFARAKSVDRYYIREHQTFTTVMLTYTVDSSDKQMARQADSLYPRAVGRKRRNTLKDMGVWDSYAGVSLLSPKYTTPGADPPRLHAHTFLWVPGIHSRKAFYPLLKKHVNNVDGAIGWDHPPGKAVTVRHWGEPQYRVPIPQGPKDILRGPTTSLPAEIGANLPYLKHPSADYVKRFAAAMWGGRETNTIARWRPIGSPSRFKELAERGKYFDRFREGAYGARAIADGIAGIPGADDPTPDTHPLDDSHKAFIEAYTTEVGDSSLPVIRENIAKNWSNLDHPIPRDQIVQAIQAKL